VDTDTAIYQDGATLHCSNASLKYLRCYFPGDRPISRHKDNTSPAHSPDISPLDYFLWGYLKDCMLTNSWCNQE